MAFLLQALLLLLCSKLATVAAIHFERDSLSLKNELKVFRPCTVNIVTNFVDPSPVSNSLPIPFPNKATPGCKVHTSKNFISESIILFNICPRTFGISRCSFITALSTAKTEA